MILAEAMLWKGAGAMYLALLPEALTMNAHRAMEWCGDAWGVWLIYWLAMSFFSKATKRRESPVQRLEYLVPLVLGSVMIFRDQFPGEWISQRLYPESAAANLACVVGTVAGLLFSAWARVALGGNWSGTVTIKDNHTLIRRGPYRWIRHPIYTGILVALLATALVHGYLRGLIGVGFALISFYSKARREESFLSQEFGASFDEHRQHTGMFLPRFS